MNDYYISKMSGSNYPLTQHHNQEERKFSCTTVKT